MNRIVTSTRNGDNLSRPAAAHDLAVRLFNEMVVGEPCQALTAVTTTVQI